MERRTEAQKEYTRFHGKKAIDKFFKAYPDLESDWRECLEWMLETGSQYFSDDRLADGTYNKYWNYAIHFDDDEYFTYICIIER